MEAKPVKHFLITTNPQQASIVKGWCSDTHIRFLAGEPSGREIGITCFHNVHSSGKGRKYLPFLKEVTWDMFNTKKIETTMF